MKALALALITLATPASAWDFSPSPICTLSNQSEAGSVRVTYDPRTEIYEIALTFNATNAGLTWPEAPSFSIAFLGAQSNTIGTDRHMRSRDGKTLSARDKGFGNVLNGLEFNDTAQARSGDQIMDISLSGAAKPVQDFRACTAPLFS